MFEQLLEEIGMDLENKIRNKILSNVPPANAPSTIKKKKSSHTLVDTGQLLNSVSHRVDIINNNEQLTCGIIEEEVAKYAAANEWGVKPRNKKGTGGDSWFIPPRSFIRSTFDVNYDSLDNTGYTIYFR